MIVLAQSTEDTLDIVLRHPLTEAGTVTVKRSNGLDLPEPVNGAAINAAYSSALATDFVPATGYIVAPFQENAMPYVGSTLTIVSDGGRRFTARVDAVNKDDPALVEVLLNTVPETGFAQGSSVIANNVKLTLTAANTANREKNYQVRVKGKHNGANVDHTALFHVGRRKTANPAIVTDIVEAWPDSKHFTYKAWVYSQGVYALEDAYLKVVQDLKGRELDVTLIMDEQPLVEPVVNRVMRRMAMGGMLPPAWTDNVEGWVEQLDEDYETAMRRAVTNISWYDEDDSDTVSGENETSGGKYGNVRLSR